MAGAVNARISFDGWTYILTAFSGGDVFDVDLYPGRPIVFSDTASLRQLAFRLVEAELGEELMLDRIAAVNPHSEPTGHPQATEIEYLRSHLRWALGRRKDGLR